MSENDSAHRFPRQNIRRRDSNDATHAELKPNETRTIHPEGQESYKPCNYRSRQATPLSGTFLEGASSSVKGGRRLPSEETDPTGEHRRQ